MISNEALHGCCGAGCTVFPQAIGLAATWNPGLIERIGKAIGRESRARGIRQVYSPVCDIARDVRAGRTEETYGEDPHLVSRMAVAYVRGLQSERVVATPKHYAANFVGDGGRDSNAIHISERLLREIYLPPYEAVIRESGALSIMSAYHSMDGIPCSADRWLLTDLLRNEWGFKGTGGFRFLATALIHRLPCTADNKDLAAMQALNAGMDVELPYSDCFIHLRQIVRRKQLSMEVLNEAVRRVLYVKFWSGMFERPYVSPAEAEKITNCASHRQLALDAARQAVVLLRNDGYFTSVEFYKDPCRAGTERGNSETGRLSGKLESPVSPLDGLRKIVSSRTKILYAEGCPVRNPDRSGIPDAVRLARQADAVVIFAGNSSETEGEGVDRCNLDLAGAQEELILKAAEANPDTVVVLISGSAITMERWIRKVRAICDGMVSRAGRGHCTGRGSVRKNQPGWKTAGNIPESNRSMPALLQS